jgi:hypothetical protein
MPVPNRAQFAWRPNALLVVLSAAISFSLGFDKIRSLLVLISKQTSPSAEVHRVISMNVRCSPAVSLYAHLVLSAEEPTNTLSNSSP